MFLKIQIFKHKKFGLIKSEIHKKGKLKAAKQQPPFPPLTFFYTMNNTIRLYCLVRGESADRAFPVDIYVSDLVGNLKELIKKKKSPRFDTIAADELTLWKVSIPDNGDNLLKNFTPKEDEKLRATWDIADYFPHQPAKKHIHIIVERPAVIERKSSHNAAMLCHCACL